MSAKKPLKEISVTQLTTGMYVVKMDISWMDSPFFANSRKIKSIKDVALLEKAGARRVTIDPNKGEDIKSPVPSSDNASPTSGAEDARNIPTNEPQDKSISSGQALDIELNAAIHLRNQIKKTVQELQNELGAGKPVTHALMTPMLDLTLESLERNNQALLNLAHISQRSQKVADHSFATFCIALNMAQIAERNEEEIEALGIAALLHESGWSQIPLQLMGKRQNYTPSEEKLIEKHTDIGLRLLQSSDIPPLAMRIIAEHHELNNGTGYPNKLSGDQIHPLSQLFSVVDRYDELVHQLNDKPGMLPTNALRTLYMYAEKGYYCSANVAQLIALLGIYPVSSAVRLSNGMKGIVRTVPPHHHLQPTIEIFYSEKGKALEQAFFLDLLEESKRGCDIQIEHIIDPKDFHDDPHHKLTLDI